MSARIPDADSTATVDRSGDETRAEYVLHAFWSGGSAVCPLPARGAVVVGRGETCALRIDHPSVSRRHARIRTEGTPTIEDLGSHNGLLIDGSTVAPGVALPLAVGSTVELGSVVLVLRLGRPQDNPTSEAMGVMARLEQLIDEVARSNLGVILLGETGAGKTRLAERLHRASRRATGPFVSINCAALPEGLLESELLGYERGAFTGAATAKRGLIEEANGGTMFLDEVGELPLSTQSKLLRVVESGEVRRVGATRTTRVDVRYVSATNRALRAAVETGQFRADLFFRLDGISVTVPPLRERQEEIRGLAQQFVLEAARDAGKDLTLAPDAVESLERHPWPGNVRELRNVLQRSAVLARHPVLRARDLQFTESGGVASVVQRPTTTLEGPQASERQRIVDALEQCAGNQSRAAKLLRISRRTLVDRLGRYGIGRPRGPIVR